MLPAHEYANDLILFALIVDCGSFSKAAEMAGVTGSVLSKRVGRLEKALGARLLYRTTRSLSVTENGRVLYQHAKSLTGQVHRFTAHYRQSVPTVMS